MLEESLVSMLSMNDKESDSEEENEDEEHIGQLDGNNYEDYRKALNGILSLFIQQKWTLKGLEDTAKFVNTLPNVSIKLPTTKYLLVKEILRLSKLNAHQLLYCDMCKNYTRFDFSNKKKPNCEQCKCRVQKDSFFIYIDVKEQIEAIIEKNFDEITEYRKSVMNKSSVTDIYNGNHLKTRLNSDDNIWSVSFNTDGVSIVNSAKSSLWPILLMCNFLPPRLRFIDKNIIVAGLYHADDKPNMHDFLKPLAEEFGTLSSNGIFIRNQICRIYLTNALLDLPAKSIVSQTKQFNSFYACNFCIQTGERTNKGVRYTYKVPCIARTHRSILENMNKWQRNPNQSHQGIKGISPMITFEHFDLADCFPIDYMHCVLLGVTKNMLTFWTDPKNKNEEYYMTKTKRNILSIRLMGIKTPSYISRRARPLEQLKHFKASEYRSLLLYYLPVCLKKLLPKKYILHLCALSSSIYQLLQPEITKEELDLVQIRLDGFIKEYQVYYGKVNMTFNVHSLIHLVHCVRTFGPLFGFSMFPFESYNGRLKNYVIASTDIMYQIAIRYVGYQTLQLSEDIKHSDATTLKDEKIVGFEHHHIKAFEEADVEVAKQCYAYIIQNGVKFTSKLHQKATKTADFFVYINDDTIGAVQFYFMSSFTNYAMIEKLHIYKIVDQVKKVQFTNEYQIINTKQIKDRCIHIQVNKKNYIIIRPNSFERN